MKYTLKAICPLLLLTLTCCKDITHVQGGYVDDRDTCRQRSEDRLKLYAQPDTYPMSDKEKNNALLALFNECMKEYGWNLGGAKKDVKVAAAPAAAPVAPAPTTVVYVQSPPAQGSTVVTPAAPVIVNNTTAAPVAAAAPAALPKTHTGFKSGKSAVNATCDVPANPDQGASQLDKIIDKQ